MAYATAAASPRSSPRRDRSLTTFGHSRDWPHAHSLRSFAWITFELGSQLRRLRRDHPHPASIAERLDAVATVEPGREFVPDRRRDDDRTELGFDQPEPLDECQVQQG